MKESGINFVLRSAYIGQLNNSLYSFLISLMQKAQFLSRNKMLCQWKLFNGRTPNLACDTATLKQYISSPVVDENEFAAISSAALFIFRK